VPLNVDRDGGVVTIELDFVDRRNALGPEDARALGDALSEARPGVALILTGRGAFCAGGDLRAFADASRELTEEGVHDIVYSAVQRMIRLLRECPVPTIAALDGAAVGLGMDLALACDMRFVGPSGWMRQGWASAGLIAGAGGIALLERLNPTVLWKLIAQQPKLDGASCERLGLAEDAPGGALAAAKERARAFESLPSDVLHAYVNLSRAGWPPAERFDAAAQYQAHFIHSAEFRARTDAILGRA
jgi:enoyl-CoA hydratase/carnithine racemase